MRKDDEQVARTPDALVWDELNQVNRDLGQVRSLVGDAVGQLTQGFQQIAQESKVQQALLVGLLSLVGKGISGNTGDTSIARFLSNNEALVSRVTEDLEVASQETQGIATELTGIDSAFRKLAKIAQSILSVSEQIRILALNADLEATRAGSSGRSFGVVASAVRELSQDFRRLTTQVNDTIEESRATLTRTVTSASAAAERGQQLVKHSRSDLLRIQNDSMALRQDLDRSLHQAKDIGDSIHSGINRCLRGLQFDDLVGQITEAADTRLSACSVLRKGAQCGNSDGVDAKDPVSEASLEQFALLQHRSVQQTNLDAGDIEFF